MSGSISRPPGGRAALVTWTREKEEREPAGWWLRERLAQGHRQALGTIARSQPLSSGLVWRNDPVLPGGRVSWRRANERWSPPRPSGISPTQDGEQEQRQNAPRGDGRAREFPYARPTSAELRMTGEELLCCLQREAWPDEWGRALVYLFEPWWIGSQPWPRGIPNGAERARLLFEHYLDRPRRRERLRSEVCARVGRMPVAQIADEIRAMHSAGAVKTLRRALWQEKRGPRRSGSGRRMERRRWPAAARPGAATAATT